MIMTYTEGMAISAITYDMSCESVVEIVMNTKLIEIYFYSESEIFDEMTKEDNIKCKELLAKAFYLERIPFEFVESKHFKRFLSALRPAFKPPTKHQLLNSFDITFNDSANKQ